MSSFLIGVIAMETWETIVLLTSSLDLSKTNKIYCKHCYHNCRNKMSRKFIWAIKHCCYRTSRYQHFYWLAITTEHIKYRYCLYDTSTFKTLIVWNKKLDWSVLQYRNVTSQVVFCKFDYSEYIISLIADISFLHYTMYEVYSLNNSTTDWWNQK